MGLREVVQAGTFPHSGASVRRGAKVVAANATIALYWKLTKPTRDDQSIREQIDGDACNCRSRQVMIPKD